MTVRQAMAQRSRTTMFAVYAVLAVDIACLVVVATGGSVKELVGNTFFQAYTVIGVLLYLRRPRNPIGPLFVLAGTGAALAGATGAILDHVRTGDLALSPATVHVVGAVQSLVWLPSYVVPLIFVTLLFPDGTALSPRWRVVGQTAAGAVAVAAVALVLATSLASTREIVANNGNYSEPAARAVYAVGLVALFVTVGCAVLAIASMFLRFRRGDVRVRQQIKLVLYSAGFAVLAMLLDGHLGLPSDVLLPFGLPLIAIAVAVAITRYRLYDIDRLVSRALSYVLLTGALVALYVASVALTTRALPFSSSFGVAASTLLAAALFHPLRRWVQRVVDRRFNRSSYVSALVVDAFAQDIRQTVDASAITSELVTVVQQTVQPRSVSLWLTPTR